MLTNPTYHQHNTVSLSCESCLRASSRIITTAKHTQRTNDDRRQREWQPLLAQPQTCPSAGVTEGGTLGICRSLLALLKPLEASGGKEGASHRVFGGDGACEDLSLPAESVVAFLHACLAAQQISLTLRYRMLSPTVGKVDGQLLLLGAEAYVGEVVASNLSRVCSSVVVLPAHFAVGHVSTTARQAAPLCLLLPLASCHPAALSEEQKQAKAG